MEEMRIASGAVGRRAVLQSIVVMVCLSGCLGPPPRREVVVQTGECPDPATTPTERPGGLIGGLLRTAASLVPRVYVSVPILEPEERR